MLSRIAESLFWLARYIERAEGTARILDVNYHMLLEQSQEAYHLRWEPLMVMAGEENLFHRLYSEVNAENVKFEAVEPPTEEEEEESIERQLGLVDSPDRDRHRDQRGEMDDEFGGDVDAGIPDEEDAS